MRILIAHRSAMALHKLQQRLGQGEVEIVRAATALTEVYDFAEHHAPDCVVLPVEMANCDEFELLATLLRILGIGCVILQSDSNQALPAAAITANPGIRLLAADASDATLFAALGRTQAEQRPQIASPHPASTQQADPRRVILIGSSTGGIDALMQVLRHFHPTTPPAVIVQHTGANFSDSLIRLLGTATKAKVTAATQNAILQTGHIYVATGDSHHVRLIEGVPPRIRLDQAMRISGHRPSVDALFHSATGFAQHVTAAILTGMGRDGADGLAALRAAGARTIGQDAATSVVYGMPRVAKSLGGVETELPIQKIGPALVQLAMQRKRR
ncbi:MULTISPECIES: chemotaxis protein CheB [unclassified Yoonia]|uniref:chemotaxis protein CheB n=1 Tax=unclassified Yoonia TaxID=2629118 RepID=UPI002AFFA397|nr:MULTISPECIES: chemotaxis protein CheB [unclassified Yoonia]